MQRKWSAVEKVTLVEMFRCLPVRSGLFTVGPFLLATAQLANSAFNGLSLTYSGAFAAVMVCFSVFVTQYHLVEFRMRRLEATGEC